ncbi:hypothetical protein H5410_043178 [Solanum commersonii]|uniref:Uncharacterized protein n=1 Tax=Solanum commersonii TaxID=4109 RepID=A0A9J5XZJ2_SOLCO|nr:hypothetical protein H5410_043178 [Solanum commersonii]
MRRKRLDEVEAGVGLLLMVGRSFDYCTYNRDVNSFKGRSNRFNNLIGSSISFVDDDLERLATKIAKLENDLQNWNIPEEPFKKIYHLGNFSFITRHNIKTCESIIAINNSLEIIHWLNCDDINRYKTYYNYLHVGLVQVAVKPLFRKGLDIPVCVLLRDDHCLNFDDSLLGVLQSNLANGSIYFNCYPNFLVDINDPNVMDSLTLNVKIKNLNRKAK